MLPSSFVQFRYKSIFFFCILALLGSLFWPVPVRAQWSPRLFQGIFGNVGLPYFALPSPWMAFTSPAQPQPQPQGKKQITGVDYTSSYALIPYELQGLAAQGDYIYATYARNGFDIWEDAPIAEAGLAVFTLSTEGEAQFIASVELPWDWQEECALTGPGALPDKILITEEGLAFITQRYPAVLWVVDLSDPADPKLVTSLTMEEGVLLDLAVGEEDVYLALDDGSGEESVIYALNLSEANDPHITPFFSLEGKVGPLLLRQGYLYVFGQGPEKGYVFDLQSATPASPCGFLDISGESAAWAGNLLYLVTGHTEIKSWLHIVDLTNPGQPALQESINLVGRELQVLCQSEYALVWKSSVFDTRHYLDILNVANPGDSTHPQDVATVATVRLADRPKSLARGEACFYVLDNSGLQVLNLSAPDDISWVWEKSIDLSSVLLSAKLEKIDHPMLDNPPSDTESTTPASYDFFQDGWLSWGPWSLFDNMFSLLNSLYSVNSKGYGPVAVNSSLYGFSGALGPWLGSDSFSYSGSGSCAYARGSVNLLDGGGSSSSREYDILNLPFSFFSSYDCPVPFYPFPSPSVSFY
ncbi:MAG: hypothetical protein AB1847_03405 [bacterium]